MLLRIILSPDDIRRIRVDSMPETVGDLLLILKTKLGLDGDIVVQFQDPDFDNELCNLSSISELPKDKATLKVNRKPFESYHGDVTLDTANLTSSSQGKSPNGSHTRQLPQPFVIPTFSSNVELKLKQGNEAYHRDETLLDISKDMKSDILDNLAEVIYMHNPYPTREEYERVAQSLIKKHPCLREPGSVNGWYGWKFSLKFKMSNFRQKLRVAGCPEVKVNSRKFGSTNLKKIKRAKKSEVHFLPDFPEGKSQSCLDEERSAMVNEMKKGKVDWKKVNEMMKNTFSLRRKEIVEDEPLVADFKERWPALFCERQIEEEFTRLTSVDLKRSLLDGLEQYLPRFLDLYRAKSGIMGLTRQIRLLDDNSSTEMKYTVLLMGLPHFLREDPSPFFKTVESAKPEEEIAKGMKIGIITVKDGADDLDSAIVLEEQIILHNIKDFPNATAMLMGLLFVLNIDYPKELHYTFEVIQKVLMNIGGGQCSSLVHGLRNKLFRKTM
ncbi:sterile alpha motif domain-containing protein 3-like [Erpetoichthys calabaricus]|uniref:sterile alpha motif domain-containing protein 3-like n=1 Tax=Erpetoichthys calabaricus TaxID=27687 RepID=UPI00109F7D19|nr:sterile alpha motif domain-containing protein 3-like [Erpetoichthys calabaricus]